MAPARRPAASAGLADLLPGIGKAPDADVHPAAAATAPPARPAAVEGAREPLSTRIPLGWNRAMRRAALDRDSRGGVQGIVTEALQEWFAARGLPLP